MGIQYQQSLVIERWGYLYLCTRSVVGIPTVRMTSLIVIVIAPYKSISIP